MATAPSLLHQENALHDHILQPLTRCLDDAVLLSLARGFSHTFKDLAQNSHQHFLSTPVTALPTGHEVGKFLAIDVGGTNLRVACVELLGDGGDDDNDDDDEAAAAASVPASGALGHDDPKIRRHSERAWPIEEHLKMDKAEDLFAWIGDCIAGVLHDVLYGQNASIHPDDFGSEIPIGITFSFPMTQESISEATLMPMGKGFAITSDLNLGEMLLAGYAKHCTPGMSNGHPSHPANGHPRKLLPRLRIAAITNDTVSTYASLAYSVKTSSRSRVAMGVVVGTGTNATVPMPLSDLGQSKTAFLKLPLDSSSSTTKIVVNTEWSVRGTERPVKPYTTIWDTELDRNTDLPGFQPIEYMTSGRYLGELVRLALVDTLSKETNVVDREGLPAALAQRNAISTKFLADVTARASDDEIRARLDELFPAPRGSSFVWSKERIDALQAIATAVLIRSTALIAAMIVGLLARVGELHLDVPDDANAVKLQANADADADADAADQKETEAKPEAEAKEEEEEEELIIACTGGLILQYPGYLETCQRWIDRLVAHQRGCSNAAAGKRVVLGEARDGGVIGAAVLAAMFSGAPPGNSSTALPPR
ncbi:hypothetical protein IWZ03DRAFT_387996 [Phyllosticta citriasiana]|uniref:Phosphotransferase n=1 Tax=Phyllosticta citriasiana TaxID=595635 RepID=A0ABR1KAM4_9PEZI